MKGVVATMNGLQCVQELLYSPLYSKPNYDGLNIQCPFQIFEVGTALSLFQTLFSGAHLDDKFLFRQQRLKGTIFNNNAGPVMINMYYMMPRRGLPTDEFPSLKQLLEDQAPGISNWMIAPTTSNTAQRYFKFGKVKHKILLPGRMMKWSLKTKKYKGKNVTRDVEGNSAMLGTKYFSKFLLIKADPYPRWDPVNPANQVKDSTMPGLVSTDIVYTRYTSWYKMGVTEPVSLFTNSIPVVHAADNHLYTEVNLLGATLP